MNDYIWDAYIKLYKLQENVWQSDLKGLDGTFPIQKILYFFKSFVPCGIFLTNFCLLSMDGHGSHVTLEAIKQVQQIGLDIITLFFTHHMFSDL